MTALLGVCGVCERERERERLCVERRVYHATISCRLSEAVTPLLSTPYSEQLKMKEKVMSEFLRANGEHAENKPPRPICNRKQSRRGKHGHRTTRISMCAKPKWNSKQIHRWNQRDAKAARRRRTHIHQPRTKTN